MELFLDHQSLSLFSSLLLTKVRFPVFISSGVSQSLGLQARSLALYCQLLHDVVEAPDYKCKEAYTTYKLNVGVEDVVVIDQDCSPHGPQQFILWNPPLVSRKFKLDPANGGGYSRTEGRARKGEIRQVLHIFSSFLTTSNMKRVCILQLWIDEQKQ